MFATTEGTERYQKRLAGGVQSAHFRRLDDLYVSSIGLGTYLGNSDSSTDRLYQQSIIRAVELGCNVLDTAINYRCQRSERLIGQALSWLAREGKLQRNEVIVSTKGGFLPYDEAPPPDAWAFIQENFITPGVFSPQDIVAGCHCITPRYIQNQLDQSLKNLGLSCIDIYHLHNPETQLEEISREEFDQRIRLAFEVLEESVRLGKIRMYGTATWEGYRRAPSIRGYLSLEKMVELAREVGGEGHHFKVIQLPYNLAMPEAFVSKTQRIGELEMSLLEAARHLGIYVMASASVNQRHLTKDLSQQVREVFPGLETDAQRAIQFVRSTPGMGTALVGMKQVAHVEENLKVARMPMTDQEQVLKLFAK
ncbi:MAG TPA: aldo/keto reductase [Nitrospiria bacterium]|nr:aldo/keto reductase [Nitrospiria bacterium]